MIKPNWTTGAHGRKGSIQQWFEVVRSGLPARPWFAAPGRAGQMRLVEAPQTIEAGKCMLSA